MSASTGRNETKEITRRRKGIKMSKFIYSIPREDRKEIIRRLRRYPAIKKEYNELKNDLIPSTTAAPSGAPGASSKIKRPTEITALKLISSPYLRRLEYECNAIELVLNQLSKTDITLIDLVYWKNKYTIEGAAEALHMSRTAVNRHINSILGLLAIEMGYIDP